MNLYSRTEWVQFREEVMKLDGDRCRRCGRGRLEVVLQVHHRFYVKGRNPWQYDFQDCETLCKGCHAQEHGHIMPRHDWVLIGSDDLGDLAGRCEACGTQLRYTFLIVHPKWPALEVGTDCCDHLTCSSDASVYLEGHLKKRDKLKRFVGSPKWKIDRDGVFHIKRDGIDACVLPFGEGFKVKLGKIEGIKTYTSRLDAQMHIFELIECGLAEEFLRKRSMKIAS